jgi:WD40 repeat protein
MTDIYKLLLLFQMRSAYRYFNRLPSFVQDLVKWDDWDSHIAEIKSAELDFQQKSDAYNNEHFKMRLTNIDENARKQIEHLELIQSLILDQTKEQEKFHIEQIKQQEKHHEEQMQQRERLDLEEKDRRCRNDLFRGRGGGGRDRIRSLKEQPIREVCEWIFTDGSYVRWAAQGGPRLLWIHGDPGQGKTMLVCGIIDDLETHGMDGAQPAYFFCQGSDERLSTGAAVLLGLIASLTEKQPSLMCHVRAKYAQHEPEAFQGPGAFQKAKEIFVSILDDPSLKCHTIIIDALDECGEDRDPLIHFISEQCSSIEHIKWLVSSRKSLEIERLMKRSPQLIRIHLDPSSASMLHAIDLYINEKVVSLSELMEYDTQTAEEITNYLREHANGTYLWVAMACEQLIGAGSWEVLETLRRFPQTLEAVYQSMLNQIDPAHEKVSRVILAHALLTQRPLYAEEMKALIEELNIVPLQNLAQVIARCRCFLAIRNNVVYWVHQSARDFLLSQSMVSNIFPQGEIAAVHYSIASRSLDLINQTVHRNMYKLIHPGILAASIDPLPAAPLAAIAYSCAHWYFHLQEGISRAFASTQDRSQLRLKLEFFLREKFLHWVEAMGLLKSVPQSVAAFGSFRSMLQDNPNLMLSDGPVDAIRPITSNSLSTLVQDALRFLRYHSDSIRTAPLQVYVSALLFSPRKSRIRELFQHEEPKWIHKPCVADDWDERLQNLEGHDDLIRAVAFSPGGSTIASVSKDKTLRLWNAMTGQEERTIDVLCENMKAVAFCANGSQVATESGSHAIHLWDVQTGQELEKLEGHKGSVTAIAFSPRGSIAASASMDSTIRIWDVTKGKEIRKLEVPGCGILSIVFSPSGSEIASASSDNVIRKWDVSTGTESCKRKGHMTKITEIAWCPTRSILASASWDKTVRLWNTTLDLEIRRLEGHKGWVTTVAFSPDGLMIASGGGDGVVLLWNTETGARTRKMENQGGWVYNLAFSANGQVIASAGGDKVVRLCDITSSESRQERGVKTSGKITDVAVSPNGLVIAWCSEFSQTVFLRDVRPGRQMTSLMGHDNIVERVIFSQDGLRIASADGRGVIRLWDLSTGEEVQRLKVCNTPITSIAFSGDGLTIACTTWANAVRLWVVSNGPEFGTLPLRPRDWGVHVTFSPDGSMVAAATMYNWVVVWSTATGVQTHLFESQCVVSGLSFSQDGHQLETNAETFAIIRDQSMLSTKAMPSAVGQVEVSNEWVRYQGKNLLWLPTEYRATRSAAQGGMLAIGHASGAVTFFTPEPISNVDHDSQEVHC